MKVEPLTDEETLELQDDTTFAYAFLAAFDELSGPLKSHHDDNDLIEEDIRGVEEGHEKRHPTTFDSILTDLDLNPKIGRVINCSNALCHELYWEVCH